MELHALPRSHASICHCLTPFIISPLLALLCPLRMRPCQAMCLYIARDSSGRQAEKALSKSQFGTLSQQKSKQSRASFPTIQGGVQDPPAQKTEKRGGRMLPVCHLYLYTVGPPTPGDYVQGQKPSLLLKPCQRHQAVAAPSQDPQDMETPPLRKESHHKSTHPSRGSFPNSQIYRGRKQTED